MKIEILISIIFILVSIFYEPLYKLNIIVFGKNNPRNWHFENEKVDKIVTIIIRVIIFILGISGVIYFTFFYNH